MGALYPEKGGASLRLELFVSRLYFLPSRYAPAYASCQPKYWTSGARPLLKGVTHERFISPPIALAQTASVAHGNLAYRPSFASQFRLIMHPQYDPLLGIGLLSGVLPVGGN